MTVSRALSENPNVKKATREAVLKRASELGYVKSMAAKAMRGDETKIVGLLLPNIVNEFYARFANAMAQACKEHSYHLIIHLTNDDVKEECQSLERLCEIQATAIIMVPVPCDKDYNLPIVPGVKIIELIRRRDRPDADATILVDDHDAIGDAVVHLWELGHRSIGYIGADSLLSSGRERLKAFREGLERAGLPEDKKLICTDRPSREMGRRCAGVLIDSRKATGVVCGGVEISNGALGLIMDRELQPNKDFAFIGYGDPSFYSWVGGGVSTVRLPIERLTEVAIELLIGGIKSNKKRKDEPIKVKAALAIR